MLLLLKAPRILTGVARLFGPKFSTAVDLLESHRLKTAGAEAPKKSCQSLALPWSIWT